MNNFDKIAKKITTKTDLVYFLDDITTAQEAVFKDNDKSLSERVKDKVSSEFLSFLKEQDLQSQDKQSSFLKELSEHLQEISQAKLTLAFSPSRDFIEKVSNWIENEAGEKVILDLTINHKITGGIIIEYRGKYLNLSLASKINKAVAQKVYEQN